VKTKDAGMLEWALLARRREETIARTTAKIRSL
jgi:hypothetical protein